MAAHLAFLASVAGALCDPANHLRTTFPCCATAQQHPRRVQQQQPRYAQQQQQQSRQAQEQQRQAAGSRGWEQARERNTATHNRNTPNSNTAGASGDVGGRRNGKNPRPAAGAHSIRINKCLASRFSRREADLLVAAGRVRINGEPAVPGARVRPGDLVTLDGAPVVVTAAAAASPNTQAPYAPPSKHLTPGSAQTTSMTYLKLHKPLNVRCTEDTRAGAGVLAELRQNGWRGRYGAGRVFPVGHLDFASSGVVLVTSDGRLVHAAMGAGRSAPSECVIRTKPRLTDDHLQALRRRLAEHGRRHHHHHHRGKGAPSRGDDAPRSSGDSDVLGGDIVAAETDDDEVRNRIFRESLERTPLSLVPTGNVAADIVDRSLRVHLVGGRPRDIRKLLDGIPGDYVLESIHRVSYMGIGMAGIEEPGAWAVLQGAELDIVRDCIQGCFVS